MARLVAFVFLVLALLGGVLNFIEPAQAAASIPIEDCSWSHTLLTVRITSGTGVANYQDSYLLAARQGIDNWRRAIQVWMDSGGPVYLGELQFEVYVAGVNATLPSYDVDVSFVSSLGGPAGQTVFSSQCKAMGDMSFNFLVQFAMDQVSSNSVMTSVATHEFGHVLGLNHPPTQFTDNGQPELMFAALTTRNIVYPSSLDLYAVEHIYSWIPSGTFSHPSVSSFSLPSTVSYDQVIPYEAQIDQIQASNNQQTILLVTLLSVFILLIALVSWLAVRISKDLARAREENRRIREYLASQPAPSAQPSQTETKSPDG